LGKAYFEEKRAPLDAEQFSIAKALDPLDPTAYLYDGIRRQTENDPVAALRDLQESIARNDNRAVYRGRLLLDKDRAARGTSLARIYSDLGFDQLGTNEAAQSLSVDPANASAHRFLSDSYRVTSRRTEVSRVSELLQSELLQDLNINPVQPSISSTNLNIVTLGGPTSVGFNEFTPLFVSNQTQVNLTGATGSNDTITGEAVVSGVYDRYSFSAGAFGYETDGFRNNSDLSHEIYNVYAQAALSPSLNVQAEFAKRNTERGDIALNFDPDDFDPTFRRSLDANSSRLGVRFAPSETSTFLLSAIYADRDIDGGQKQELFTIPGLGAFNLRTDVASEDDTTQYDAQYIHRGIGFNFLLGGARTDVDRKDSLVFTVETPFGDDPPSTVDNQFDIKDSRFYSYLYLKAPMGLLVTLGAAYSSYEQGDAFDFRETSPKIGAQWAITESLALRGAYLEGVKPALSSNRTLEPTQVAGFSQFFDDANGTKYRRYGIGVDWRLTSRLTVGGELSKRDLDWPTVNAQTSTGNFEDRDEWFNRAYVYWVPADRWAVNAELSFDKFRNASSSNLATDIPERVVTYKLPVAASYFHPSGVFGTLGVTYVDQQVRGSEDYLHESGDSTFTLLDLAFGYRLPKRGGILSLAIQNATDKSFDFIDDSYRSFQDEPALGPFYPERTITARFSVNF
jgi:hypothetical protein